MFRKNKVSAVKGGLSSCQECPCPLSSRIHVEAESGLESALSDVGAVIIPIYVL